MTANVCALLLCMNTMSMFCSLINSEILVEFLKDDVILSYSKNGTPKRAKGKINEHIINDDFDIVLKAANLKTAQESSSGNELYSVFNSIESVSDRMISGLQVSALDVNAKTILISFKGHNAQLCHDLTWAVSNSFISYDEEIKRRSSENVIKFIDNQLDSLSGELKSSKDSLVYYQRKSNLSDPEMAGNSISENIMKLQDQ